MEQFKQEIVVCAYEGTDPQVLSDLLHETKSELMRKMMEDDRIKSPSITSANDQKNLPIPTQIKDKIS